MAEETISRVVATVCEFRRRSRNKYSAPESLDWKTIEPFSANLEPLCKYLPVATRLELPRFAEHTIRNEIARRACEYVPSADVLKDPGKHLQPGWLVLHEIHRPGQITIR